MGCTSSRCGSIHRRDSNVLRESPLLKHLDDFPPLRCRREFANVDVSHANGIFFGSAKTVKRNSNWWAVILAQSFPCVRQGANRPAP